MEKVREENLAESMKSETKSGNFLLLNLSLAILGMAGLFARWVPLHPSSIIAGRTIFGALALWALLLGKGERSGLRNRKELRDSLITGVLLGIHWTTMFHSIQLTGVSVGLFTLYTFPVLTAILEPLFEKRIPSIPDFLLSLYVLAGVVAMGSFPGKETIPLAGVLWGLLSALLYALRNIYTRKLLKNQERGSVHLMFHQLVFAFLVVFPLALISGEGSGAWKLHNVILLFLLGAGVTAVGHTIWMNGMKAFSATTIGIISCSAPVYSSVFAILLQGERPGPGVFLGGTIILSGVLIEVFRENRRRSRVEFS